MSGTHQMRLARIEAIAMVIDFLDLLDGDIDIEPEEDCCAAGDDDPASAGHYAGMGGPGDPADAEDEPDLGAGEDEGLPL